MVTYYYFLLLWTTLRSIFDSVHLQRKGYVFRLENITST